MPISQLSGRFERAAKRHQELTCCSWSCSVYHDYPISISNSNFQLKINQHNMRPPFICANRAIFTEYWGLEMDILKFITVLPGSRECLFFDALYFVVYQFLKWNLSLDFHCCSHESHSLSLWLTIPIYCPFFTCMSRFINSWTSVIRTSTSILQRLTILKHCRSSGNGAADALIKSPIIFGTIVVSSK